MSTAKQFNPIPTQGVKQVAQKHIQKELTRLTQKIRRLKVAETHFTIKPIKPTLSHKKKGTLIFKPHHIEVTEVTSKATQLHQWLQQQHKTKTLCPKRTRSASV